MSGGILGSGSSHFAGRYGQYGSKSSVSDRQNKSVIRCQKCLQHGHYTYECKNEATYAARPSRSQQLKNPKLRQGFLASSDLPPELNPALKEEEKDKEKSKKKRKASPSSSSSSSSDSDSSSSSDSDSDSGSSSSSGSGSSSSSSSSDSSGSDSGTSSDSSSDSSDSEDDNRKKKKRKA